jgi:MraZ protein
VAELLGEHRYQMDPKGRISLPGKFREELRAGVYITLGGGGCLWAFPPEEWDREREKVQSWTISQPGNRAYARVFFGNAERVELDGQGRLVVPRRLRDKARLDKDVIVVGVADRLEIWSNEAWEREQEAVETRYRSGDLVPERE